MFKRKTHKNYQKIGFFARLRVYFLAGLLVTAPISITLYLAWIFVDFIDQRVTRFIPEIYNPETYLPFSVPGIGVLAVIIFLIFIGAFAAGYIGKFLLKASESVFSRTPVLRTIYGALKQILETVLHRQSSAFRKVVLFEYPRKGLWAIGFVTGENKSEVQEKTKSPVLNVFVPTTPNPTSGFLLFVPEDEAHILDMSVEEAIKLVISGGIIEPKTKSKKKLPKKK